MSFLPSLKPGNIRAPITTNSKYFGKTNDTFVYEPHPGQIAINKTNPCSGNTEIAAGVLKIYEPSRFGAPDSPNFVDNRTNNGLNAEPLSGLGHNNHLNVKIGVNGSDNNFRIHYDDSPNADFITLAEGDHAHNYNYYSMRSSTTAKDDRGVYRQAAFRIVHSTANEGDEEACFDIIDFAADPPNEINYAYHAGVDEAPFTYGNPIVDLHVNLTDKSSGTANTNLGLANAAGCLYLCERLDIRNTANRRVKGNTTTDNNSVADFYRNMRNLVEIGPCPYFITGSNPRDGVFRRCMRLTHLDDTWADPERSFIQRTTSNLNQAFFQCQSLKSLPANLFTCDLNSPNDHIDCENYNEMFYYATDIEHIPRIPFRPFRGDDFYKIQNRGTQVHRMFYGAHSLRRVPEGVHLKDLRIWNSNGHNNAAYAGISGMFYQCWSLEDFGDIDFRDIPLYEENLSSPSHPYRIPMLHPFANAGYRMKTFPYMGSFEIMGGTIADGGPATANDAQQLFQGHGFDFDSPYVKHGINFCNANDIFYAMGYNAYGGAKHMKIRWIHDSPRSKDLSTAMVGGGSGTSSANNTNKRRMFYNARNLQKLEHVGWNYWTDNWENDANTEYEEMNRSNHALREVTGMTFVKANDSGDYNNMFNGTRSLERMQCGGEKRGTFDGSNDYVDTNLPGTTISPNSAHTITLSAVVEIDTLSALEGYGRLIVIANGSSTRAGIEINREDDGSTGRAHFRIGGTHYASDGTGTGATAVAISAGEKVHVCATLNYSTSTNISEMKLYVDGVLTHVATNKTSGVRNPTTIKVGTSGNADTHFFDGKMYDVRIYDDILTAAEVKDLAGELLYLKYNETAKDAETNLVLHYDFEDGHGTTLHNKARSSRFGGSFAQYNGTINGATSAEFWANFDQFGPKYSFNMDYCPLTPAALREIFVCLPTVSSGTFEQRFNTPYTNLLTAEDKAIATDKGWTLSFS